MSFLFTLNPSYYGQVIKIRHLPLNKINKRRKWKKIFNILIKDYLMPRKLNTVTKVEENIDNSNNY